MWEGNKDGLPSACTWLGSNPQFDYVPRPGIKPTATFWCMGQYSNLLSHTGQGINALFSAHCGGKIKRRKAEIRWNASYLRWNPPLHLSDCASVFFCASVSSSTAMYLVPCQFLCILILVFRLAMLIPVWCESFPAYVSSLSDLCASLLQNVSVSAWFCTCMCVHVFFYVFSTMSVAFISVGGCLCLSVSVFNALPHKNG